MNKYEYIYNKFIERVDLKLIPAASFFVAEKGKEVYRKHLNYKGNEIFRLASMTKPITAVAALKAQELGLINIEDEITKYIDLDGFKHMKIGKMENGKPVFDKMATKIITIKDILRHQSGIGSDEVGYYQTDHRKEPLTLKEAIEDYSNWYLDFNPGSKSIYSGRTALDIVCYIIELTSKMPYYEFLKKYILNPLNMVDTTYKLDDNQKNRLANMYDMNSNTHQIELVNYNTYAGMVDETNEGYPCGAAGLFSTLEDYSHFAIMLSNKGFYNNNRILTEESVYKMANDIIELPCPGVDKFFNWGYCVFVRQDKVDWHPLRKGTYGWSGAYSCHFFIDVKNEICAIMMTQVNNDGGSGSPNIKVFESAYADIVSQDD